MSLKDLADNFPIHPRISLWAPIICLAIVLLNNHVYLRMLETKEKENQEFFVKLQARENAAISRERVLRNWEMELMQRERDFGEIMRKAKVAPSAGSGARSSQQ